MKSRPLRYFLLGALTSALVIGMVSYSYAASDTTIIYACVNKSTQVIRYVPKKKCSSKETALSWNVSGPRGVKGETGSQGIQGPRGLNGNNGSNGLKGETGSVGPKGETGIPGTNGTNGTQGETGPAGANGTPGSNGTNGTNGTPGTNGANGTPGSNGTNGTNGTNGEGVVTNISRSISASGMDTASFGGFDLDNAPTTSLYSNSEGVALEIACIYGASPSRPGEYLQPGYFLKVKNPTGSVAIMMKSKATNTQVTSQIAQGTNAFQRFGWEASQDTFIWTIDVVGSAIKPVRFSFSFKTATSTCDLHGMYSTK